MNSRFALFPEQASTIAGQVDWITLTLLLLCGAILVLVAGLILGFGILYRKGSPHSREIKAGGSWALEWGWTFATFFLFLGIFGWATFVFFQMHTPPPDAMEIRVVAKQWMWKFQHPNGRRELDELHIPIGNPIVLTMTSQDVIHSLYIPEFRIKQDVLPDRYTKVWFQPNKLGEYHLLCAEYCGTDHAKMGGRVFVLSQSDYQRWLGATQGLESGASRGRKLFTQLGCMSCHGTQSAVQAPSLFGLYGRNEGLSNGKSVFVDDDYLRESILNPRAKIVKGYLPLMPTFAGLVNEGDLMDLIAYIKSLKNTPPGEAP